MRVSPLVATSGLTLLSVLLITRYATQCDRFTSTTCRALGADGLFGLGIVLLVLPFTALLGAIYLYKLGGKSVAASHILLYLAIVAALFQA